MARREPIEIALGDRTFRIRALTIDQMEKIEAIVVARDATSRAAIPVARDVLKVALERDYGSENLGEIECEPREIAEAMQAVLVHGGFLKRDVAPGEGQAAAATTREPTGDGSEAGSPPASA